MGMFELLDNFAAYNIYISAFKRRHGLDPFTTVSVLKKVGYGSVSASPPLRYPCLISSTKAFAVAHKKIYRVGGAVETVGTINKVIVNEIYCRSQAKKLVYPSKGPLALSLTSVKIDNSNDLDVFIEAFWENYRRNNERNNEAENSEHKYALQMYQVNKLCDNAFMEALPCIVTLRDVDIDNLLTTVVVFFVLTKEEAKSLVYHSKNMGLEKQKYNVMRAYSRDDIPF